MHMGRGKHQALGARLNWRKPNDLTLVWLCDQSPVSYEWRSLSLVEQAFGEATKMKVCVTQSGIDHGDSLEIMADVELVRHPHTAV